MMLLAMGLWTDNEQRELIRLAITYLGVDGLLLNFIQEYVTGHAAIARAHDVSHRFFNLNPRMSLQAVATRIALERTRS